VVHRGYNIKNGNTDYFVFKTGVSFVEHFNNFCHASHVDFVASSAGRCVRYSNNVNLLLKFIFEDD